MNRPTVDFKSADVRYLESISPGVGGPNKLIVYYEAENLEHTKTSVVRSFSHDNPQVVEMDREQNADPF